MSSFIGMDTGDVRSRAALLNAQVAALADVDVTLRRVFEGSTWMGHDAEIARERLHDMALPALRKLQEFLQETALRMIENASQQEQASSG